MITGVGEEAISIIDRLRPDVLFLDIHLHDITGFEILRRVSFEPYVIFTTAYHEYALKAFDHLSIDYLLKPISQERFNKAIKKLVSLKSDSNDSAIKLLDSYLKKHRNEKKSFSIKLKDRIILVEFEEIFYFKADDKYVNIVLENGKNYLISQTLTELESELPGNFIRVHRSYIVNKSKVVEIRKHFKGKYVLRLSDRKASNINTSRTYKDSIREAFSIS